MGMRRGMDGALFAKMRKNGGMSLTGANLKANWAGSRDMASPRLREKIASF